MTVLLQLRPDVCGHLNGGTTSLDDAGLARIIRETDMSLQLVQAGNLRSALHILRLAREVGRWTAYAWARTPRYGRDADRCAQDLCELSSLGDLAPEVTIALATGNNARAFRVHTGRSPWVNRPIWSCATRPSPLQASDALGAIARGDIPGISCVVVDGEVRVGRSRNTPLAKRLAAITGATLAAAGH